MRRIRILSVVGISLLVLAAPAPGNSVQGGTENAIPHALQEVGYLGQAPPGAKAEPFAPQILAHEPHDSPKLNRNETWILFSGMEVDIIFYGLVDGRLTEMANPLGIEIPDVCNGITLSHSENRAYIREWKNGREYLYCIDKTENGWTDPKYIEIEGFDSTWQFSVAANENIYFATNRIMVSVFDGESHTAPRPLKVEDNTDMSGSDPYISPDEDYIVYGVKGDLHISYKLGNGLWSKPVNLGPDINSDQPDICPQITPNGKYLIFNSRRDGSDWTLYWADASFIEKLRPKE